MTIEKSRAQHQAEPPPPSSTTAHAASRSPAIHREESDDEGVPMVATESTNSEAAASPSADFIAKAMAALEASKVEPAGSSLASPKSDEAAAVPPPRPHRRVMIFPVRPFDPKPAKGAATSANAIKTSPREQNDARAGAASQASSSPGSEPYDLQKEAASWLAARKAAKEANTPPEAKSKNGKARKRPSNASSAFHEAKMQLGRQCGPQTPPAIAKAIEAIPFWAEEYDYSATEDEVEDYDADLWQRVIRGRRRALKRQLTKKVNAAWPPNTTNLEAEIDLMRVKYVFDDDDFIKGKAQRKSVAFHQALPYRYWFLESVETLLGIIEKYKDAQEIDPFCPRFRAAYMAMNARMLLGDIVPGELVPALTDGRYRFTGLGGGIREPAAAEGATAAGDEKCKSKTRTKKK